MSKTYSMPGWRIGFAVGNERIIAALARVKSYLDYGAFTPVQVAATARSTARTTASRRCARSISAGATCWWNASAAQAGTFAAARLDVRLGADPRALRDLGSVEFAKLLVEKAELAVSPGIGFGERGEGHVRIALVENEQRIRQAARNIRRFLETGPEKFHNVVPLAQRR